MESVFWWCLAVLAYAFAGYPLALRLLVRMRPRRAAFGGDGLPSVTMILSAFNEEAVIADKIRNFLDLEYPPEKMDFIIVSDGSTDRTEEIVAEFVGERARLLVQETNQGKTAALNRAADETDSDILVFTDANSMFDRDAVRKLAGHFADPEIGLVSGHSEYVAKNGESGSGAYRRYEDSLKEMEGSLWGVVGADGAIYAMRRSLYRPMRPEHINDFLHPIQAVMSGYAVVQEQGAICREPVDEVGPGELKRQTRIMTQSWIIVFSQLPELVKNRRIGFLWQLFSHKILRWLTLPLMALLLAANLCVLGDGGFYVLALVGQIFFYAAAYAFRRADGGIKQLPYSFLLLHLSAVIGLVQYFKGEKYISWKPRES
ncbi:glycosyltransferase family 2 protein [Desulfovibrio sp. Fe33]|uniref:glycosyltransferase family 2 protein n=1 Tax=Desulfovibrio sp. Fe33 TaxID=3020842 RepID=UPI00234DA24A|nr:glycosyltransferase family 2 protein [Desulfovibrio sp. Fe33]